MICTRVRPKLSSPVQSAKLCVNACANAGSYAGTDWPEGPSDKTGKVDIVQLFVNSMLGLTLNPPGDRKLE
jgi:hypothetical protein